MQSKLLPLVLVLAGSVHLTACGGSSPPANQAKVTWVAVADWYFDVGKTRVYMDGALTRFDPTNFYGGATGLAYSHAAVCNNKDADQKVLAAIGQQPSLVITGHSNLDHSYDTATIAKLSGARIIGSPSTCFEAEAQGFAASQCTAVMGGETMNIGDGMHMRVVHWNHSGNASNPELHLPLELTKPPTPDANGCLKPGVLEDFPNGGGARGYLFVGGDSAHRFSIFFVDTGSDYDFAQDVPDNLSANGTPCGSSTCGFHGSPQGNLTAAMQAEGLDHVDLWIGFGTVPLSKLVVPILKPKAFIPNHLGSFYVDFFKGLTTPYTDTAVPAYFASQGSNFQTPKQFLDSWTVDATGTVPTPNTDVKTKLGF